MRHDSLAFGTEVPTLPCFWNVLTINFEPGHTGFKPWFSCALHPFVAPGNMRPSLSRLLTALCIVCIPKTLAGRLTPSSVGWCWAVLRRAVSRVDTGLSQCWISHVVCKQAHYSSYCCCVAFFHVSKERVMHASRVHLSMKGHLEPQKCR
jgi:hypothetical protein